MKYFKIEYWEMMNSIDKNERNEAFEKWNNSVRKYSAEFEKASADLPEAFLKHYLNSQNFHDAIVTQINYMTIGDDKGKVDIGISTVENHYVITYLDVEKFLVDIPQDKHWLGGEMRWGYDEFEKVKGGLWEHRILTDGGEIQIIYKKLKIQ